MVCPSVPATTHAHPCPSTLDSSLDLLTALLPFQQARLGLPLCWYVLSSFSAIVFDSVLPLTPRPAGGAAYYFAKKSINADRQARLSEQRRKKSVLDALEQNNANAHAVSSQLAAAARTDAVGSPSQESSSSDPAPTRHAPATETQRVLEKSKYEASVPFRSPKGDRFS